MSLVRAIPSGKCKVCAVRGGVFLLWRGLGRLESYEKRDSIKVESEDTKEKGRVSKDIENDNT